MENDVLNLRTSNYYVLEEELCLFMLPEKYSAYREQIHSLAEDLWTEYVVCIRKRNNKNETYYIFMTRHFKIFANRRSGYQNFQITKLEWGRDLQAEKKKMYNEKTFLIVLKGGMKLAIKEENHTGQYIYWTSAPQKKETDQMSASALADLGAAIDAFFENDTQIANTKISRRFREQIIQPIQDYTYYEQQADELAVYGDNYMIYDRYEVVSGKARRKLYAFYSMSYDPDSEIFSIGNWVSVETIIKINDERKKMIKGKIIDLTIVEDGVRLLVELTQQFDYQDLRESHGYIYPQVDETQKRVRREVVDHILDGTIDSQYMYQFFTNYKGSGYEPQPDWNEFQRALKEKKRPPNGSQMEAIKKGIETKDIQLVLGPPGTGKTTVIVTWVNYFIRQGKRVLVSSQNNAAVDNVLERIGGKPGARVVRLGNIEKIQENCKQYSVEIQAQKTADLYIQRLSKSKGTISADIHSIDTKISQIDQASDIYRTKGLYEDKLNEYANQLREKVRNLENCYHKGRQCHKRYQEYHDQKIHKQVYLYAIKKKGRLVQLIHSRTTKRVEQDAARLKGQEKQAAMQYIKSVEQYNDAAYLLWEALYDGGYRSAYQTVNLLNDQCNKYSFSVLLQGPFRTHEPSIPNNLNGNTADERLAEYRKELNDLKDRLNYVAATLNDWEKSIQSNRTETVTKLLIQDSNVVGATCIGINSNPLSKDLDFDVSIIDECGQIQIHDIIVPMTRAPKTLMLGDHKQIPPHVNPEVEKSCKEDGVNTELLEKSFFEYLFEKIEKNDPNSPNISRLTEQFRMPGVISDVIAKQFYDGNYYAHYDMSKWNSMIQSCHTPLVMISTSTNQDRFEESAKKKNSKDKSPGYSNHLEAETIAHIISRFYVGKPEEVGVISAYARQVRLIREEMRREDKNLSQEQINSMVATLDSFQGQERPLIIYSLTRSNNYMRPEQRRIGFMIELRRLNVAFTRCQKQLVIIGDIDYLTHCKYKEIDPETGKPLPYKDEEEFSKFLLCMENQAKAKGEFYNI